MLLYRYIVHIQHMRRGTKDVDYASNNPDQVMLSLGAYSLTFQTTKPDKQERFLTASEMRYAKLLWPIKEQLCG